MKRQEDRTILLSTHIMRIAEQLCDRFVVINEGRMLGQGTLPELQQLTGAHYLEDVFRGLLAGQEDAMRDEGSDTVQQGAPLT